MSKVLITPEFINLESPPVMRALLQHIFDRADIVGHDPSGHPVLRLEFGCDPWLMDKLAAFGTRDDDLELEPEEAACQAL